MLHSSLVMPLVDDIGLAHPVLLHDCIVAAHCISHSEFHLRMAVFRGVKQGEGSQPPLNFRWGGGGVNTCQPPPDFEKILLGGIGSPQIDLTI